MKYNKVLLYFFLAIMLGMGLTACKKDKNADTLPSGIASLTVKILVDNPDEEIPIEDILITSIDTDGGSGFNILFDVPEEDRTTDEKGIVTFPKLLPGNYQLNGDIDGDKITDFSRNFQVFDGKNEVVIKMVI